MREATTQRRQVLLGYLASMGAAMGYGTGTVVARKIATEIAPPLVGSAFSLLFGILMVGGLYYRHALSDLASASTRALVFISLAGLAGAWGVGFYFLALEKAQVVLVASIGGLHPLVAILLTHIFLQRLERVTLQTVAGGVLVAAGVTLIVIGRG